MHTHTHARARYASFFTSIPLVCHSAIPSPLMTLSAARTPMSANLLLWKWFRMSPSLGSCFSPATTPTR